MRNKVHVDRASTKIITMVCSNCTSLSDVLQVYFLFLQNTQPLSMEESRKIMYLAIHIILSPVSAGGTALYNGTILSRS